MPRLTFEFDVDDYLEEEETFSDFLIRRMRKSVLSSVEVTTMNNMRDAIAAEMNKLTVASVEKAVGEKLDSFMREEIAITDRWGKPNFIGTIEDLMKKSFDERLFYPVDSRGERASGCSTSNQNWVQWKLEKTVKEYLDGRIDDALRPIKSLIEKEVKARIDEATKGHIVAAITDKLSKTI
jgi:hypothetical protein